MISNRFTILTLRYLAIAGMQPIFRSLVGVHANPTHIFIFLLRKGQQRHPFLRGAFFNYSKILFRKKDTADGPTHHPDASGGGMRPYFYYVFDI